MLLNRRESSYSNKIQYGLLYRLAVFSIAVFLSACSSSSDSTSAMDTNEQDNSNGTVTITVSADGNQEVPANGSLASATGTLSVDEVTRQLSGSVTVNGMSVDSAHIHAGSAGNSGGVEVALIVDGDTLSVPESTLLSEAQYNDLVAGNYYLNVHSENFPGGEIRGQLLSDNLQVVVGDLSGESEMPPVTTNATGVSYITVDEDNRTVSITVRTEGIAQATAAHVHLGYAGQNGAPIITLDQVIGSDGVFATSEAVELSAANYMSLLAGETYINVHSSDIPGGELRSQISPSGINVLRAQLNGEQQITDDAQQGGISTLGSGIGYVTVNANTGTALAYLSVSNLASITAAHIHQAPVNENGPVMLALSVQEDGSWSVPASSLDAAELNTLLNGGAYMNVHTVEYPNGEIRGQLE